MRIHVMAAIALCASAALFGQEFRGTFSGLVTDAQGAAIAKAKIVAIEKSTGNKAETLSSETGEYTIPFLTPGEYEITAEMAGFKTYKREGLTLSLGEHPVVDIKLELGATNQSVMVSAEVPMIRVRQRQRWPGDLLGRSGRGADEWPHRADAIAPLHGGDRHQ